MLGPAAATHISYLFATEMKAGDYAKSGRRRRRRAGKQSLWDSAPSCVSFDQNKSVAVNPMMSRLVRSGPNGATRWLLPPYRGVRSMQLCSIRGREHFLPHSVVIPNCQRHLSALQSALRFSAHLLLFSPAHLCSILYNKTRVTRRHDRLTLMDSPVL